MRHVGFCRRYSRTDFYDTCFFFEFEREPSAGLARLPIEVVALMNQNQSLRIKTFESRVAFMHAAGTLSRQIAARMMVAIGLSLTIVWIAFLGYGLVSLVY